MPPNKRKGPMKFCCIWIIIIIISLIFFRYLANVLVILGVLLFVVLLIINSLSSQGKEETKAIPPSFDKQLQVTQEKEEDIPPQKEELPKYCPECGSPLTGEYCEFCGAKIQKRNS